MSKKVQKHSQEATIFPMELDEGAAGSSKDQLDDPSKVPKDKKQKTQDPQAGQSSSSSTLKPPSPNSMMVAGKYGILYSYKSTEMETYG